MIDDSRLKYFVAAFSIIIFILLLLVFIYVFSVSLPKETEQTNFPIKPYQVLTPKEYGHNATVSLYKVIPPIFPKEVVLENKALDYSGVVTDSQGRMQVTVSYISDQDMKSVANLYSRSLPGVGWNITEISTHDRVSIIRITKVEERMLISIAPLQKGGTMVTFQYEE